MNLVLRPGQFLSGSPGERRLAHLVNCRLTEVGPQTTPLINPARCHLFGTPKSLKWATKPARIEMSPPCPELTTPPTVAALPLTRRQVTCTVNFADPSKVPTPSKARVAGFRPRGHFSRRAQSLASSRLGFVPSGRLRLLLGRTSAPRHVAPPRRPRPSPDPSRIRGPGSRSLYPARPIVDMQTLASPVSWPN